MTKRRYALLIGVGIFAGCLASVIVHLPSKYQLLIAVGIFVYCLVYPFISRKGET